MGWTSIYQLFWGSLGTRVYMEDLKLTNGFWLDKWGIEIIPRWYEIILTYIQGNMADRYIIYIYILYYILYTYSSNQYKGIAGCALNHSFLIPSARFRLLSLWHPVRNRPLRKKRLSSDEAPDEKKTGRGNPTIHLLWLGSGGSVVIWCKARTPVSGMP